MHTHMTNFQLSWQTHFKLDMCKKVYDPPFPYSGFTWEAKESSSVTVPSISFHQSVLRLLKCNWISISERDIFLTLHIFKSFLIRETKHCYYSTCSVSQGLKMLVEQFRIPAELNLAKIPSYSLCLSQCQKRFGNPSGKSSQVSNYLPFPGMAHKIK